MLFYGYDAIQCFLYLMLLKVNNDLWLRFLVLNISGSFSWSLTLIDDSRCVVIPDVSDCLWWSLRFLLFCCVPRWFLMVFDVSWSFVVIFDGFRGILSYFLVFYCDLWCFLRSFIRFLVFCCYLWWFLMVFCYVFWCFVEIFDGI
jgi:hypothetical protein